MPNTNHIDIPCLVIQLNQQQFITNNSVVGSLMQVPCDGLKDSVDYWFVPVKDEGIFSILQPILKIDTDGNAVPKPTFDSFTVCRVRDRLTNYTYWIYGSISDFNNSCATCCGDAAVPMPGIGGITVTIAPCQIICLRNDSDDLYSVFGLPTLVAGQSYFPIGSYDNIAFTSSAGGGYATRNLLLTFLNASWTNTGSPASGAIVWTSPDPLTLIATGGHEGESICVLVNTV